MKYVLKVIYYDNTFEEHEYNSYTEAYLAEYNYKNAFGNQVAWTGVIERR